MYIPAEFQEADLARARALVAEQSFGLLVVAADGAPPEIAHIPFLLDADPAPYGTLRAHVARGNPIARLLTDGAPAVAVFSGPHAYVTPRWYESPNASVPTWNYTAVHAHGVARAVGREDALRIVRELTVKHERGADPPWDVDLADPAYVARLLGGIVAFSIRIERFEAKAKLSQNRSAGDREGVVRGLRARGGPGDAEVAALVDAVDRRR